MGNELVPDPPGDIAEIGAVPRQSHVQYHVFGSPLPAWGEDAGAGVCAALLGTGVEGVFAGSAGVESGVTDPPVTLTCEIGPLSPGLSMRTLTLMFAAAAAGAGGWVVCTEGAGGCG